MTRDLYVQAAILALFGLPAQALAAGITYDCDTAAGHFSELVLPSSSRQLTVSGNVRLNAAADSKDYAAIVRIQVASPSSPGHTPSAYAGFSVSALPADARKMQNGASVIQMLSWNVADREDELLPLSILTKPGAIQPFRLSFDGRMVTVTLGKEEKSFPFSASEASVRIVCSTGEFLITDLMIGGQSQ
jgi:hypothetical protein